MEIIANIEKQYIFEGLVVEFIHKEDPETKIKLKLKLSDVITTGPQRTIISESSMKSAFTRHIEKLNCGFDLKYEDMKISSENITVRYVLGECWSSFKTHGYSRIYCSTSGFALKPLQTRTGSGFTQHALFPLYREWKISEIEVEWDIEKGTVININNVIQDDNDTLNIINLCSITNIGDLPSKYDFYIDAIEAAIMKSREVSTSPVFYRDVKKVQ